MEIREIPKLPEKIKEGFDRGELIVFIGAGMSYKFGCSTWDTLAENLIKGCECENLINNSEKEQLRMMLKKNGDNRKIITMCYNIFEKSKNSSFMKIMKKSLKNKEASSLGINDEKLESYRNLLSLNSIFVTTNADRYIDKLFLVGNQPEKNIIKDKFNNKTELINKRLYKIHGSISDEKTLVFTLEQYFKRYRDENFKSFMVKLFQRTILFVGYGLGEFELLEYMYKDIGKDREKGHFYLKGYFSYEKRICDFEQMYFKQMGIKLIPYLKDEKGFEQLSLVIKKWVYKIQMTTNVLQNNYDEIDEALKNPTLMDNIESTIIKMRKDQNYGKYFFQNSPKYKKLYLWLKPLYKEKYFEPEKIIKHGYVLGFLKTTSLQNKEEKIDYVTQTILDIVNNFFDYFDYGKKCIDYDKINRFMVIMVEILFNLPKDKISINHVSTIFGRLDGLIGRLDGLIVKIILPFFIKNDMRDHILRLLEGIFGYHSYNKSIMPTLDDFYLDIILKDYCPEPIFKIVKIDGLKVIISIIKNIIKENEATFDHAQIVTIEKSQQNNFSTFKYYNQLISFTRDLLEYLDAGVIRECIKKYLQENHPIFKRLALHIINKKYEELKEIFWSWFDNWSDKCKNEPNLPIKHEFFELLKDKSCNFTDDELNRVIGWIENLNYVKYDNSLSDNRRKKIEAYRKKEWLLAIKKSSSKATKLYERYDRENPAKIKHPGYYYYFNVFESIKPISSEEKLEKFCKKEIEEIVDDILKEPSEKEIKKASCEGKNKNDLIEIKANDLKHCIKQTPHKYALEIEKFEDKKISFIYKDSLIVGFTEAWRESREFDWDKVFDFILKILDDVFSEPKDQYALRLRYSIAELIKYGTKSDDNAFNKKHLLKAKKILFLLIEKKLDEKIADINFDIHFRSDFHNYNGGVVLDALINYMLRYGRLNSDKEVKWENDVKKFFTQQLSKNTEYSKLIFIVLGDRLQDLRFLDREWVDQKFNLIFPLCSSILWEFSISSYFLSSSAVNRDIYKKFKDDKHIKKALEFEFKSNIVKQKIIRSVCIMFIYADDDIIFDVIASKNKDNIIEIIKYIWYIGNKDKITNELRCKVFTLLQKICDTFKEDDDKTNKDDKTNVQDIFSTLSHWLVFINKICCKNMPHLELIAKYTKMNSVLLKELERLAGDKSNVKHVGKMLNKILKTNFSCSFFRSLCEQERMKKIVLCLYENEESTYFAKRICNIFRRKNFYFLNKISKKKEND